MNTATDLIMESAILSMKTGIYGKALFEIVKTGPDSKKTPQEIASKAITKAFKEELIIAHKTFKNTVKYSLTPGFPSEARIENGLA